MLSLDPLKYIHFCGTVFKRVFDGDRKVVDSSLLGSCTLLGTLLEQMKATLLRSGASDAEALDQIEHLGIFVDQFFL